MKQVIILVGPQGSGKSTFCKESLPNHFRISQDEMGAKEHWNVYLKALDTQDLIVVDRINHTRAQRAKYLDEARKRGFETRIIELFETYGMCVTRCIARKDHPTIQNYENAINALSMYFNQYEIIRYNEADQVLRTKNNPIVTDLTEEFIAGKRFIVVGDIHGCYDEFEKLLKQVNYDAETDIVVSAGDLVDRGPKIKETVQAFLDNDNFYAVQGNHDNKFMRWLNQNKVNPVSLEETIAQFGNNIDKKFLFEQMMNKMSNTIIKIGFNYITHAGFNPRGMPEDTTREFSLYARYYDDSIGTFSRNGSKYWYDVTPKHDYNMFFGHNVHEDKIAVAPNIYALDGGAVFGGKLRCAIIHKDLNLQFSEVQSKVKVQKDMNWDYINKFEPYDKLVEQGFLRKQESQDLVLFNYSEKTQYESMWNNYTVESRGLILDKNSGDTIARPFPKFWNFSELIDEKIIKKK